MFTELTNLIHLPGNLYITDFLDILIITGLIYSIFVFLRGTRTTSVMLGMALTFFLYLIAKGFNLFVTLLALKYFVGVSLVIFVIIFQNEIRKYFEFVGLIGARQIRMWPLAPLSPTIGAIIQACVGMAQDKTGSLMVIQGKDSLDEFIDGGIELDGIVSEELLMSLFEKHSEGHDGAVIIKQNRVVKFATHLPLSTNFKEIGKHGTRHSAGLGLSEISDSLSIVVSEEKGQITICKDGKLKTLSQFTDLEKELERYIKSRFMSPSENILMRFIKHNFKLKVGALISAFLIWYIAAYRAGTIEKTFNAGIVFDKLPKDTVVESYSPKEIKIKASGRGNNSVSNISSKDFKVTFDMTDIKNGVNKLPVTRRDISVPQNLSLVSFESDMIVLTAKKYNLTNIPINPKIKGVLPTDLELKNVEVTPTIVKVWVLQDSPVPTEISTDTIDISEQKDTVVIPVKLVLPENMRFESGDSNVNVAITIASKK